MKDIPSHLWHDSFVRVGEKKTGGPNLRLLRLDPSQPANTVTAYIFNKFAHPTENRYITPREAARLQQFPDDHIFSGPITKVQLQIGNAVPVGLGQAVAQHVHKRLKARSGDVEFSAVSLFAGAGGLDLGFEKYFKILASNEIVPEFCETLRCNFKDTKIVEKDISNMSSKDLTSDHVDVVFGGPPCQPFSAAGKQRGVADERGALIEQYLRIVEEISPRYFVLENVPGLVTNQGGGALRYILESSRRHGYDVEWFVLRATDYGVPQRRHRLIVIGRKGDLVPLGAPTPTHSDNPLQGDLLLSNCATVGDAFKGLGSALPRVGLQESKLQMLGV